MQNRYSTFFVALAIVIGTSISAVSASARIDAKPNINGQISVAIIDEQMADLVKQTSDRNVTGMLKHYSRDVKVAYTLTMAGQQFAETLDYNKLEKNVRMTFSSLTDYTFEISKTEITLLTKQTAKVDYISIETMNMGGTKLKMRAVGTSEIRMEDGQPRIIRVNANVVTEVIPQ